MDSANVTPIRPPEPPFTRSKKISKPPKFHPSIERALRERQRTVWNALAILELIDYAQPSREAMSWKQWNAVLLSVYAAAELLRKVIDLGEARELAAAGKALLTSNE